MPEPVKLALYASDTCMYCHRVFAAMRRLGVEIEIRDRDEPQWRADLRARTGRTQVPCLLIDEVPMFESLDIIRKLEELVQSGALVPTGGGR